MTKIASRDELRKSGENGSGGGGDSDDMEGSGFQSFHGASRNVPIQDAILSAATAFQAKGPQEYLDGSSHHHGPSKAMDGGGEDEEDEQDDELAQPILLKDP